MKLWGKERVNTIGKLKATVKSLVHIVMPFKSQIFRMGEPKYLFVHCLCFRTSFIHHAHTQTNPFIPPREAALVCSVAVHSMKVILDLAENKMKKESQRE